MALNTLARLKMKLGAFTLLLCLVISIMLVGIFIKMFKPEVSLKLTPWLQLPSVQRMDSVLQILLRVLEVVNIISIQWET